MNWQPIETAPKDVRVLLWTSDLTTGHYDSSRERWYAGDECFLLLEPPTHWCAIEPPKETP